MLLAYNEVVEEVRRMLTYVVLFYMILAVSTVCISLYFMHGARHGWH